MTRRLRQSVAPRGPRARPHLLGCLLLGMLSLVSVLPAKDLPFGQWTHAFLEDAPGLAGELLIVAKDNGFVLHDTKTLEPRLIIRDGHYAVTFTPDGQSLVIGKDGYDLLNLETGLTTPIVPQAGAAEVFVNAASTQLLALIGEPNRSLSARLRIQRLDLSGHESPADLGALTPLSMEFFDLTRVLPSRLADHVILILRDKEETGDAHEPYRMGDYQFVHLNLNTGKFARLSTLASPSNDFYLDSNLNWTSPTRDLLNAAVYPDYAYTLIDPYVGKITRVLKVPGVKFNTNTPGEVTTLREVSANGTTQLFRDYLEPGTLKTIRNVPVASATDFPERPAILLPEGYQLLTPPGPNAIASHQESWDSPYTLALVNTTNGEVAQRFNSANNASFRYGNITFHPSQPEFFANTYNGDVHFFRFTDSGLKRQVRGSAATSIQYAPDGESVVSTSDYEGPYSTTPAASFPFGSSFTFEYPRLQNTDPEYDKDLTVSPRHTWFITQTYTLSTLYRFGEPAIAAELPRHDRELAADTYAFSADEQHLARLTRERHYDENTDTETLSAELSVLKMETVLTEVWKAVEWSLLLPHGDYQLAGWNDHQELMLVDPHTAELEFIQSAEAAPRRVPIEGLTPGDFASGAPVTFFDQISGRLFIGLGSAIAVVDPAATHPAATLVAVEGGTQRFHRLGDQRHIVAELSNGSLVFLDPSAAPSVASATLEFYNDGQDYLLRTPAGRFDATPEVQRKGFMLAGYRPQRLVQIISQGYDPELFTRLFAGLPTDVTPLPDVIKPPTATITAKWISALRYQLKLQAQSIVQDLAEIRLYQNDKLIRTFPRGWDHGVSEEIEVELLLVPENHFRLVATSVAGIESLPAELTLSPPAAELARATAAQRPAELHLIVIGVNEYRNPEYNLNFAVPDADAVLAKLEAVNRPLFTQINSRHLANTGATHDAILAAFAEIKRNAQPHDAFLFYFAGHGVMSKTDQKFYLIPHDVTRIYGESQSLTENGISADQLRELSASIAAQKQLFILDACNSGGALQTFAQRGASQEKALAQLARATGTHWIAASSANQFATEFAELGHGAFTHTLLQALDGNADTGDKRITINELKAYLESELPAVTQRYKGAPQYPSSYGYGQDFPIALLP